MLALKSKVNVPVHASCRWTVREHLITTTAREVVKRLMDEGWYEIRQSGSHKQFRHENRPGTVTVSMHKGDIPKGTLAGIFRQAGWEKKP